MALLTSVLGASLPADDSALSKVPIFDDAILNFFEPVIIAKNAKSLAALSSPLTLTATESRKKLHIFTAASGAFTILYPAPYMPRVWVVYNLSGQNLTIKTTAVGSTGPTIPTGKARLLFHDDTSVYSASADIDPTVGTLSAINLLEGYTTTATAGATTTLTSASTYMQFFTGTLAQTVLLPVTSTLALGWQFLIVNNSTGSVTVQSSGANNVIVLGAGASALVTCILTSGTTAASWDARTLARTDAAQTFTGDQSFLNNLLLATGSLLKWSTDLILSRKGAANLQLGAADAVAPVAQSLSAQSTVAGTSNTAGANLALIGSLGTSQGRPGKIDIQGGALIPATGSTQQTAVSRLGLSAALVLTNNTVTTLVSATVASNSAASGIIRYSVECTNGTDVQIETGMVAYQIVNKGGVFSLNTVTQPTGYPKNAVTSGTLVVTFAASAANPCLVSVNANSSLTPSTGYPRIVFTVENLTNQSIVIT